MPSCLFVCFSYLDSEISTNIPVPFLISTLQVDCIEVENYRPHQESRNKVASVQVVDTHLQDLSQKEENKALYYRHCCFEIMPHCTIWWEISRAHWISHNGNSFNWMAWKMTWGCPRRDRVITCYQHGLVVNFSKIQDSGRLYLS